MLVMWLIIIFLQLGLSISELFVRCLIVVVWCVLRLVVSLIVILVVFMSLVFCSVRWWQKVIMLVLKFLLGQILWMSLVMCVFCVLIGVFVMIINCVQCGLMRCIRWLMLLVVGRMLNLVLGKVQFVFLVVRWKLQDRFILRFLLMQCVWCVMMKGFLMCFILFQMWCMWLVLW